MVAPFAPHVADELWSILGEEGSIHLASWPVFDPAKISESTVSMAIQVNGKVRSELVARADESDAELRERALADAKITPWISGKTVDKVIIVKGKLISIVVK
jgi:leucyl-tRNA synthetase